MPIMSPFDAGFLLIESRTQPMHVGGLQVFELPDGAGDDWLTEMYQDMVSNDDIAPLFRQRATRSLTTGGLWAWTTDADVDLEHHVRHSALARPGRVRELLALVSRLHAMPLDRRRPLWEFYLIEGLENRRFAIYSKLHHSLLDGVSALKLLERSLTDDPDDTTTPPPWAKRRGKRSSRSGGGGGGVGQLGANLLNGARDVVGLGPELARLAARSVSDPRMQPVGVAPRTILNVPITGSRRYAAQGWSLEKIRKVASAGDATINDVVLAMSGAALREYLRSLGALPEAPLVAMTPVSLRKESADGASSGNAVGAIKANLATNITDPLERLETVKGSINMGKEAMAGASQLHATALSMLTVGPMATAAAPVLRDLTPPPFNIIVSNVPGPQKPLYARGAKLQGLYPLSIPVNGQALNITVTSYNGSVDFGLTGCRKSVPHLQQLLGHLDRSLDAMAEALGV
jgi:diacylglycerol O-acyltransferase